MKSMLVVVAATMVAGCASVVENGEEPKLLNEVPAWNAMSPEETYKWFMNEEYGVRPAEAERPRHLAFKAASPDRVMMDGAAVRKMVCVEYGGKYGTNSFVVTAFVPNRPGPHPAFLLICNRDAEMPCDQHQFLALMAPRLVAVASASEDAWAGQRGEYESCVRASGAWEAQGLKGLVSDGFPPPDSPLQEGSVSYHLRTGKHNLTGYDWNRYMDFADRHGWRRGK